MKSQLKLRNMFLKPWIGKDYYNGINGERVMIFGESHYDDEAFGDNVQQSDFTPKVVEDIIGKIKNVRFFKYVGQLFHEDWKEIWNKVAFANLIQYVLAKGDQPTAEHIETITSFYEYLDELKPDKAIVFSSRAWLNWFPKHIDDKAGIELNDKYRLGISYVFKYPHSAGHTLVIGVNHTSSREKHYVANWKHVVTDFLTYKTFTEEQGS